MANVLNRATLEYISSAHTPDYSAVDWVINPDMSAVEGVPHKYWKLTGDVISEMSQAEKDAVDAAEAPILPVFHASSVLVGQAQGVLATSPDWTELGGAVTTPSFFSKNLPSCVGRVVGKVRSNGTGGKLRLRENDSTPSGTYDVPDTNNSWQIMQWFTPDAPTAGTNTYTLEGQLPISGATECQVKHVAVSLLEIVS